MEEKKFSKLDYTIHDVTERVALVDKICKEYEKAHIEINSQYLTVMADYCLCLDVKKEYKDKSILTKNRMVTINKREQSYEALQESLPGGDNDIYNLLNENPKGTYLTSREEITEEDIEKYPDIKVLKNSIENLKSQLATTSGKNLFILKKTIIEMQKDQYLIKTLKEQNNIGLLNQTKTPKSTSHLQLTSNLYEDENGDIRDSCLIDLSNRDHVKALLHMYSMLKEETWDKFDMDLKYLLYDLEQLADSCMENIKPVWYWIMIRKIDGASNEEIAAELKMYYETELSVNTISTIWCNGIPKLIAETAAKRNTINYYNENGKKLKTCSKCHKQLPPTKLFFHTNNKSSDKLYSVCKECRKVG